MGNVHVLGLRFRTASLPAADCQHPTIREQFAEFESWLFKSARARAKTLRILACASELDVLILARGGSELGLLQDLWSRYFQGCTLGDLPSASSRCPILAYYSPDGSGSELGAWQPGASVLCFLPYNALSNQDLNALVSGYPTVTTPSLSFVVFPILDGDSLGSALRLIADLRSMSCLPYTWSMITADQVALDPELGGAGRITNSKNEGKSEQIELGIHCRVVAGAGPPVEDIPEAQWQVLLGRRDYGTKMSGSIVECMKTSQKMLRHDGIVTRRCWVEIDRSTMAPPQSGEVGEAELSQSLRKQSKSASWKPLFFQPGSEFGLDLAEQLRTARRHLAKHARGNSEFIDTNWVRVMLVPGNGSPSLHLDRSGETASTEVRIPGSWATNTLVINTVGSPVVHAIDHEMAELIAHNRLRNLWDEITDDDHQHEDMRHHNDQSHSWKQIARAALRTQDSRRRLARYVSTAVDIFNIRKNDDRDSSLSATIVKLQSLYGMNRRRSLDDQGEGKVLDDRFIGGPLLWSLVDGTTDDFFGYCEELNSEQFSACGTFQLGLGGWSFSRHAHRIQPHDQTRAVMQIWQELAFCYLCATHRTKEAIKSYRDLIDLGRAERRDPSSSEYRKKTMFLALACHIRPKYLQNLRARLALDVTRIAELAILLFDQSGSNTTKIGALLSLLEGLDHRFSETCESVRILPILEPICGLDGRHVGGELLCIGIANGGFQIRYPAIEQHYVFRVLELARSVLVWPEFFSKFVEASVQLSIADLLRMSLDVRILREFRAVANQNSPNFPIVHEGHKISVNLVPAWLSSSGTSCARALDLVGRLRGLEFELEQRRAALRVEFTEGISLFDGTEGLPEDDWINQIQNIPLDIDDIFADGSTDERNGRLISQRLRGRVRRVKLAYQVVAAWIPLTIIRTHGGDVARSHMRQVLGVLFSHAMLFRHHARGTEMDLEVTEFEVVLEGARHLAEILSLGDSDGQETEVWRADPSSNAELVTLVSQVAQQCTSAQTGSSSKVVSFLMQGLDLRDPTG